MYILDIKPLVDMICKYFLSICRLSFYFFGNVFLCPPNFILMKSKLTTFFFGHLCFCCHILDAKSNIVEICPCVLLHEFYGFSSYIWVIDSFWVNLYGWWDIEILLFFFLMWKSSCSSTICWKQYSFTIEWTWHTCQNQHRCMGWMVSLEEQKTLIF